MKDRYETVLREIVQQTGTEMVALPVTELRDSSNCCSDQLDSTLQELKLKGLVEEHYNQNRVLCRRRSRSGRPPNLTKGVSWYRVTEDGIAYLNK